MTAGRERDARRVADVLAEVVSRGPRSSWPAGLVQSCCVDSGAAGVGLTVVDDHGFVGVVAGTPGSGQAGEDLQLALAEGPGLLSVASGQIVHAPDLAIDTRWMQFGRQAAEAGIAAATSIPLLVGAVRVGALTQYRSASGPLDRAAGSCLLVYAEVATAVLLLLQHGSSDESGGDLLDLVDIHPVVHQAAGMVAIQLDQDLAGALLRLRAHAFLTDKPLREVAAAVVARRLVLDHSETGSVTTTEDDDDEHT